VGRVGDEAEALETELVGVVELDLGDTPVIAVLDVAVSVSEDADVDVRIPKLACCPPWLRLPIASKNSIAIGCRPNWLQISMAAWR
jgi:hypothetical protein